MTSAELLNSLDTQALRAALTNSCASQAWVDGMIARRPFADDKALLAAAEQAAESLTEAEWLETFAAHPMIGDLKSLRQKYAATKSLAANEQSGVTMANDDVLQELAAQNRQYVERFGFIFIIFATGKTADEMLALLKSRIDNPRDVELKNAAREQLKITQLRLQTLASRASDA